MSGYSCAVDTETAGERTAELAEAFAELAGALAHGYDVVDLLDRLVQHCVHLLEVDAAGLILADSAGALTLRRSEQVTEQLQTALNSRVIIEQAKGMLAQQGGGLAMAEAFAVLRQHARRTNQRLTEQPALWSTRR